MNHDIRVLNDDEILSVSGACHGTGTCPNGSGKGDGLGKLREVEGAIIDGLVSAAKSVAGMF